MYEVLRPFYYFKDINKIIVQFYRSCEICIKNKSKLDPATKPYVIMSIDHSVGGFGGNKIFKKVFTHFSGSFF